jgi:hypothetical protein
VLLAGLVASFITFVGQIAAHWLGF